MITFVALSLQLFAVSLSVPVVRMAGEFNKSTLIDIVAYGLATPVILSALPLMKPGYDLGAEHLRAT
ncbi:hypothetical protein BV898_05330 [Hypsibius exemplaris]|uniref:Uncharacterized protein n=1 Tax=Hypsibius exemplaris TaxID=2072580 RepID=A0A1W0X0A0_HYPEX|nr:hypothetical protein BV898_05330 [Hypsibius exemplaris]